MQNLTAYLFGVEKLATQISSFPGRIRAISSENKYSGYFLSSTSQGMLLITLRFAVPDNLSKLEKISKLVLIRDTT